MPRRPGTRTLLLLALLTLTGGDLGSAGESAGTRLDLILVLDQSGSMRQSDPERLLVSATIDLLAKLEATDAAGLVVFGGQAKASFPLTPLTEPATPIALRKAIGRLRYGEARTNIAAGIERGLYEIKERGRPGASPALLFITDGIMDTGSAARDAEMREWLRTTLLPEARSRGVRLYGIALTEEADYGLIQAMAAATEGDYFRVLRPEEIPGVFGRILAAARARAAQTAAGPPPAPAPPRSTPRLVSAGFWVAMAGVLALVLVGGLILMRRLRPSAPMGAGGTGRSGGPGAASTAGGAEAVPGGHLQDPRTGRRIPLTAGILRIGRAPDNHLVIPEPQVSSHHAEIEFRQGRFYLRDLRSTNGTRINRSRIQGESLLRPGDEVAFDEFTFVFGGEERTPQGTVIRELPEGTLIGPGLKPPAASGEAQPVGTVAAGTEATINDARASANCPAHPELEATEPCPRCGRNWCALCNPPAAGERCCRQCRESRLDGGAHAAGRPGRPPGSG